MTAVTPRSLINEVLEIVSRLVYVYYVNWSPTKARLTVGYDPVPEVGRLDLKMLQQFIRRDWDDEAVVFGRRKHTAYRDTTKVSPGSVFYITSPDLVHALGPEKIKQQWPRISQAVKNTGQIPIRAIPEPGKPPGRPPRINSVIADKSELAAETQSRNSALSERQRLKSKAMMAMTRKMQRKATPEDLRLLEHYENLGRQARIKSSSPRLS